MSLPPIDGKNPEQRRLSDRIIRDDVLHYVFCMFSLLVVYESMIILGESSFWFCFRSVIQFLPFWAMDDKAQAETKIALAKYYLWKNIRKM